MPGPISSFFNNHKQNRSATALPTGNNVSSTSLPSPHPQQQPQQQPHLQHPQQLQAGPPVHQQEYQAYSPPPESLSAQQQAALQQAVQQQQQLLLQQQQQQQNQQQNRGPARHSSVSGPPPTSSSSSSHQQDLLPYLPAGLIRQSSGAAESQQTLVPDNNTSDARSYSSTTSSGTAYEQQQYQQHQHQHQQLQQGPAGDVPASAPVPAKSTLRKPLQSKETSSSNPLSGLFHRSSKHDQSQDGSSSSSSIGRRLSTRKSNPSPQQSPNIPQRVDENKHYIPEPVKSPRPQSLLPPAPTREHVEALRGLKRSDTDAPAYSQQNRPPSIVSPLAQSPGQPQPYYNIATGQYGADPSHSQQQQQQQQQQQGPPKTPNLQNPQGQRQPPPQQQYPGHKSQSSQQQQIQPPQTAPFARSSSDLSALEINTNHPGAALTAHSPNTNAPVSPGTSVHTVDTMSGNPQSAAADGRATPTGKPEGNGGSGAVPGHASGMPPGHVQALMTEFDVLQTKYRKVKNLYFDRAAEIERLQNTMANQRMALSRTALDDNQYSSRFERLDGAIKNLAFEIRQSWKVIPGWLQPVVNPGAELKGGREMTVVGRAAISRWVVDEILDRYFHPALDVAISSTLKGIENGIRRNSPQPQSIEEDDNLSHKVCQWRMSTIDGVKPIIDGQPGRDNVKKLKEGLEEKLMASLAMHLNEPLPLGLPGGVATIIEISIGLLENLPMESRDVRVWYPLPGEKFDGVFMRGETGLQPLLAVEGDKAAILVDGMPVSQVDKQGNTPPPPPKDDPGLHPSNSVKGGDTAKKPSVFKGIKGKITGATGGSSAQPPPPQQAAQSQPNPSQTSLADPTAKPENSVTSPVPQNQPGVEKVRVAGFMAVEVRGKSILIKAPVWT
ncbi:hypothetical protein H072_2205 [Dactylellina haptotyla CBS 200.50]|uniref:S-adenosylmethionine-dependent methyltransferase-like protein n=1 Tax=Dactylellina haptotyla (strain CBS 200.50) TaxID=1284197 RepID=S8BW99_DACHA|nr:hypothetical protein H072_2205 [Dactylellina haptotyla CBS 200.50]